MCRLNLRPNSNTTNVKVKQSGCDRDIQAIDNDSNTTNVKVKLYGFRFA